LDAVKILKLETIIRWHRAGLRAWWRWKSRLRGGRSQGWRIFVHNHADAIASIDMFEVTTISFGHLYGVLILRQSRREFLWLGVTAHPNAE
jgi:hypothetical protein